MQSLSNVQANLEMIRRYGVGVQIDDFGTGYSSLSLLKDLPFDAVKIDQSFVRNLGKVDRAETIIQAVVDMGENSVSAPSPRASKPSNRPAPCALSASPIFRVFISSRP